MPLKQKYDYTLTCIAVDDEPFARKLIADDISKIPFLKLQTTCSSAIDAEKFLRNTPVDLLFLDIQMPAMTGLQFLKNLKNPPLVVITTAYEQYAIEGYELDVIDYLLKPFSFDRFLKATTRAYDQFVLEKAHIPSSGFFFVHSEYKEIKLFYDDVLYVEGLKDYVKIFVQSQQRPILTRLNLKAMENKLPQKQFCRIHNSYIVSLNKISSFQKAQVFIKENILPISDKYAELFEAKYKSLF